jgi:benzoylformate decarboxylase
VLASPAQACAALADRLPQRGLTATAMVRPQPPVPPGPDEPLRAGHVIAALGERLPADALLVEEAPSNRPELFERIAVRTPFGFLAVANGALGFGLSSAVGLRMALPERPVVALLGDGSSMYTIQSLWTAARYGVGVVFVVLANGHYAVMDELADSQGAPGAWPGLDGLDLAGIATGLGCLSVRVTEHGRLIELLDDIIPGLRTRTEPLLLDVHISPAH